MLGITTGENVRLPVAIELHNLWSAAGASPDPGHLCGLRSREQLLAFGQFGKALSAFISVHGDESLGELADEKVLFSIAVPVSPRRTRISRGGNRHRLPAGLEHHRL